MNQIVSYGSSPQSTVQFKNYPSFTLSETKYLPGEKLAWHSHSSSAFIVVLAGGFEELGPRASFDCRAKDVLFRSKEHPHRNRFHQMGGRCLNIELSSSWLGNYVTPRIHHQGTLLLKQADFRGLLTKLYHEFLVDDPYSSIAVEGLLLELVAEIGRMKESAPREKAPPWLAIVQDRLHSQFGETITIGSLASSADVHPTHMIRAFRKHFRCTVGEYLRRVRIEFACRQLAESPKSLARIALDSGFADQSHFTVAFKRSVGVTPGRYRYLINSRLLHKKRLISHNT